MKLRPYQENCLKSIREQLQAHRSTLAVMATGCGKTIVFSHAADGWQNGRVLVLAHREELIAQAASKLHEVTGERPQIEMAGESARVEGGLWEPWSSRFVIASVQSLSQDSRLLHPTYSPLNFGLVVIDEAHHCVPSNKTYGKIVQHFQQNPELRLLGVTATPDRADELAMGQVFESVAFDYGIREGIDDGYLVPIEQQYVMVKDLDFSQVRTTAGDLNEGDLERILTEEKMLHKIAGPTIEAAGDEPTLIFTVSVSHAELLANILNRHKAGSAVSLSGKTPKDVRREQLKRYHRREFQYLVGCDLFIEGFDCPIISVVVNAKPTKSRARYAQTIGRGTRTLPGVLTPELDGLPSSDRSSAIAASGKPRLLVLDFAGNSGRHKLISTADILAGEHAEAAVERAKDNVKKSGKPADMTKQIELAEEELAEERRQQEEKRKFMEEKAKKDRERIKALTNWQARTVDPFGDGEAPSRSGGFGRGGRPPSIKQLNLLQKNGIDPAGMTHREAQQAIDDLFRRWDNKLATPKQEKLLKQYGELADGGDCSKTKASLLLDLLKSRGWRRRDYALTRDRLSLARNEDLTYSLVVRDTCYGKIKLPQRFATPEECRQHYADCVEDTVEDTAEAVA